MEDNSENKKENQIDSTPLMESIPVENEPVVEEVAPEVDNPSAVESPPDNPPVYQENKNQYLMFFLGGAVIFIVVLFLILKAFFSAPAKKSVSLTYWGLWEDSSVMNPIIKSYESANPGVTINYEKMDPGSYRDKLVARSKSGQGPDIFRFHNTWLPEISDVVAPLPPTVMSNSEFEKTFYPVAQKDLKVGNYYYGIPLEIDGLVLVYNNGLFKKAGISAAPTTWDDITNIVPKLTVKDTNGQLITSGIAMGTTSNIGDFSDIFGLLLAQNGGSLGKLNMTEASGALEIYRKFAEDPQGYWNDNMPDSITAFVQEKVAMIIVPSWDVLSIKASNPDLDFKVVPVPTVPGSAPMSISSYWVEGVSRYSKNQLEAWKFLKYLSQKDTMTKLYELETKVRPFGEPYSRVDLAPLLVSDPYVGAVIKEAPNFVSLPLVSNTFDNGLNDEIIKYIENAINSTIQGVSYSEALQTASQGVSQVFTKYGITVQ